LLHPPRGTLPASHRGIPTTVPGWKKLLRKAKAGDPDAIELAKAVVTQANNTPAEAKEPFHYAALKQWKPKTWSASSANAEAGPSTCTTTAHATSAQAALNLAGSAGQSQRSNPPGDPARCPPRR